ncbi:MAG: DMT family transporter [Henriciella sp.]
MTTNTAFAKSVSSNKLWLVFTLLTLVLWGVWGAFSGLAMENGVPETLVYCVWSVTMIPPALIVLARNGWKLETSRKAIFYGMAVGLLGAGGQLILFKTLTSGPAYLVFPLIALSPVVTIALSLALLGERTSIIGWIGIALAIIAVPMLDYRPGGLQAFGAEPWFFLTLAVMLCWGVQAYFIKLGNEHVSAESIFFYMMLSGLLLAPIAWFMTPAGIEANWGLNGAGNAFLVQSLNAFGALFLVLAFRYGKAIVVSPLTNAGAPLATAVISLVLLGVMPGSQKLFALGLALIASVLLAIAPESKTGESDEN